MSAFFGSGVVGFLCGGSYYGVEHANYLRGSAWFDGMAFIVWVLGRGLPMGILLNPINPKPWFRLRYRLLWLGSSGGIGAGVCL